MAAKKTSRLYRFIRWAVKKCYPTITNLGVENLPAEPVIIVGNHSQMNGPIACELYTPGKHYTWCISHMMYLKEVPAYAYKDFWSNKPGYIRWFYKLLSYAIAPLAVCVFNNAATIPVYHDNRILTTFKRTVSALQDGANIVIFPEDDPPHNHIVNQFREKFVDVARLYYKRTGKQVCFVPMYLAPKRREMHFGTPIRYCAANDPDTERTRICDYLMEQITDMACSLPEHTVVPFNNVPKKQYKTNKPEQCGAINR